MGEEVEREGEMGGIETGRRNRRGRASRQRLRPLEVVRGIKMTQSTHGARLVLPTTEQLPLHILSREFSVCPIENPPADS